MVVHLQKAEEKGLPIFLSLHRGTFRRSQFATKCAESSGFVFEIELDRPLSFLFFFPLQKTISDAATAAVYAKHNNGKMEIREREKGSREKQFAFIGTEEGGKREGWQKCFLKSLCCCCRRGGTNIMPDMGNQMGKERKEKSTKFSNRRVNFFTKCIGVFQNQNSILENMSKNSSCLSR